MQIRSGLIGRSKKNWIPVKIGKTIGETKINQNGMKNGKALKTAQPVECGDSSLLFPRATRRLGSFLNTMNNFPKNLNLGCLWLPLVSFGCLLRDHLIIFAYFAVPQFFPILSAPGGEESEVRAI